MSRSSYRQRLNVLCGRRRTRQLSIRYDAKRSTWVMVLLASMPDGHSQTTMGGRWSTWGMVILDASEPPSLSGLRLVAPHLPPLLHPLSLPLAVLQAWVSWLFTFLASFPLFWSPHDPGMQPVKKTSWRTLMTQCWEMATEWAMLIRKVENSRIGPGSQH